MSFAADLNHPRIPGFDRFYAAPPAKTPDDDAEPIQLDPITGGRILLGELNCTSCHVAGDLYKSVVSPKRAPILDNIGSRVKVDWLRMYLANPNAVKPGTTMPDVISTLREVDRAGSVEALVHFLASTGTILDGRADIESARKGESLMKKVGCVACHNPGAEKVDTLTTSVPLPDLAKKYTGPSLMTFLKDPLEVRPSGRMPAMGLSDEDYRCLALHFVRDGKSTPNTRFAVYLGSWESLPNFAELKPAAEGETEGFDLTVAKAQYNFAVRFTTYVRIQKTGDYRFFLGSDDGGKLWIDNELVVDCNGTHPHEIKNQKQPLEEGFHKVVVEYFQAGGQSTLELQISGQGIPKQPLSGHCYLEPQLPPPDPNQPTFVVNPELVSKGRNLFESIGCAACHQMTIDGKATANKLTAKPLAEVSVNSGCLAEKIAGKSPRYELNAVQRTSLIAAIKSRSPEMPRESVHRNLATLNCYACHNRNGIGGVEEARNDFFESLQKEIGDEGRLPPTLTGVGDKLRPDWLRHVLQNGASDRKNYMVTQMPRFGANNVDSLVAQFSAVDTRPETSPSAHFAEPEYRIKGIGRHLIGGSALSCIKCHDFGPHPSTGIRAINLTTMHKRLRGEWFYRYMLDPQEYRRGTRMPSAWPSGKSSVRDVLNGDANQQIQAVWLYLADGEKSAVPTGLVREPIELKPTSEPIIYRNFIEGAGARAIGVGYPEGINLAFDANEMRLAMIWQGAFMDASRHWTGRGQGFEPPLGDFVLPLPPHVPFFELDTPDRPVPTEPARDQGYRFLGYRLDEKQRPHFRYSRGNLTVEDASIPDVTTRKHPSLRRTLRFSGNAETSRLWYRAAVADKLENIGQSQYRIDGTWTISVQVTGNERPMIRTSGNKRELLVPIRLQNGRAEITQLYLW